MQGVNFQLCKFSIAYFRTVKIMNSRLFRELWIFYGGGALIKKWNCDFQWPATGVVPIVRSNMTSLYIFEEKPCILKKFRMWRISFSFSRKRVSIFSKIKKFQLISNVIFSNSSQVLSWPCTKMKRPCIKIKRVPKCSITDDHPLIANSEGYCLR